MTENTITIATSCLILSLCLSFVVTLIVFLISKIYEKLNFSTMKFFIVVFALFFCCLYFRVNAKDDYKNILIDGSYLSIEGQVFPNFSCTIDYEDLEKQQQKQFHLENAHKCFKSAHDRSVFLPDDKRKIASQLFLSCVHASVGLTIGKFKGLVAALLNDLADYGVFMVDQGLLIKKDLDECEYHYEMWTYWHNR